ncbi:2-hydroxy-3-oxopropionate reductase [Spirosoma sp. KCTC 42546]|uniref:2-hydroxy-3-oxopropionate reductase n=1 Tax=Spirosoma sp. KCTC 42546 TaxID=2520506 RepID=UPI0011577F0B|nr:2-hydroxy-3-oxopropionate reductase [Spirosoma sp. KCTC 42546]QDK78656.1 2-hydroxy-3-oxopropionate reductase [Spirosoma sp. KCTC 42546]
MEKIGFIGLGIMGKPMALNLLKAGYVVTILSHSKAAAALIDAGAQSVTTCKLVAQQSDIIITMLPDAPVVEQVLSGPEGALAGIQPGSLFIDMSTVSPSTATHTYRLIREKGVDALDAPVSGGQVGAETATLSIMVGGDEAAFQRALPIFQAMGKTVVHVGESGAGQTTKACNQLIVGITIQAVAEAFTLAQKAGVDLEKMREVLLGGFAQSRILDLHGKRIINRDFQPGGKLKFHQKDMAIALQIGEDLAVSLKGTALVATQMDKAVALGLGDLDHSALALLVEANVGPAVIMSK